MGVKEYEVPGVIKRRNGVLDTGADEVYRRRLQRSLSLSHEVLTIKNKE